MTIIQALGWYYPESLGGTEVYVAGLSHRLRAAGHRVFIAAPDPTHPYERAYEHDGLPVYRFPIPSAPTREECQGKSATRGVEHFHTWMASKSPDVVHIHTLGTGLGLPEVKAAKATGARVIVTTHYPSLGYVCQRGTMMRWGERLCDGICRPAKCASCSLQSRGLPKSLASVLGAIPPGLGRIAGAVPGRVGTALAMSHVVAWNQSRQRAMLETADKFVVLTQWALDVVAANGAPRDKLALNRLGLSHTSVAAKPAPDDAPTSSPINVGYLGRFDVVKGVHDLVRAVVSLPRHVSIRVEFRGPVRTDTERRIHRELQILAGDDLRITFAEEVCPSEVLEVLARYDVLCCPSIWLEGGPTVAIEAQAVGTPVVGTRIGGLAEIVRDGVNGALVNPGDWRALAAVLRRMAEDPANTIDLWRRALSPARGMDDVAAEYLALYQAKNIPVSR